MPEDIRLRVGTEVVTLPLNGGASKVAAVLTRFATSLGIPITGTATENLTAILEHVRDDVKQRSKVQQQADLRKANEAAITATVDSDNAL